MKINKWLILLILLTAGTILLFGSNLQDMKYLSQTEAPKISKTKKYVQTKQEVVTEKAGTMPKDHSKQTIDCKTCHYCEYPTINEPCLSACPRQDLVSVHHAADEGPEIVEMDMIKGDYGVVVFSHKLHAEMSEMTGGCQSCHHYNTTGPVLKCVTCHEASRIREDLSKPDLEAAYHRQCLNCHRKWSRETKCQACHINEKSPDKLKSIKRIKSSKHPKVHEPEKVVYETEHESGKIVTFFHDQHVKLYNLSCTNCHQDENCMRCHDVNIKKLRTDAMDNQHKTVHKTFEQHHEVCSKCHENSDCGKCHKTTEMTRFNHFTTTGFDLNPRHNRLKCTACHTTQGSYKGLSESCESCHQNFKEGQFNHLRIGLQLDDTHAELACSDCHKSSNFAQTPKCNDCHDDKYFPHSLPGKRIQIQPEKSKKK